MIYGIIVSSVYMNFYRNYVFAGFFGGLDCYVLWKTIMTRKLFDNMMDVACFTSIICVPIAAIQMFLVSWGNSSRPTVKRLLTLIITA